MKQRQIMSPANDGPGPAELTAAPSASVEGDAARHLLSMLQEGAALSDGAAEALSAGQTTRHQRFLNALGVAVYTTDAKGRITFFNEAATELWGRAPKLGEQWCGSLRLYWPDGRQMAHSECPLAIALGEQRPVRGYETMAERPDGSRVWFMPFPTPMHDEQGQMIGAVNVLVDVTERRRAEEQLRATAQELHVSNAVKDEFLGLVSHELR